MTSFQVYAGLDYYAEPADIWSCGIVLVALLSGGMLTDMCDTMLTPRMVHMIVFLLIYNVNTDSTVYCEQVIV